VSLLAKKQVLPHIDLVPPRSLLNRSLRGFLDRSMIAGTGGTTANCSQVEAVQKIYELFSLARLHSLNLII
jgi:hypothetical protein